ncbi:membrane protease subunit HflC [Legionella wadsworthii]|uniref:Protein HflC n=1 Tax=Legionella wadsworthii TaxID=28088 RepID=A0A378LTY0_9GAMM|nr:protease modulator HflC [Legionella wadsworthii]STY30456.1 membrane protease subunit HflC [Legionella wadsworthii]
MRTMGKALGILAILIILFLLTSVFTVTQGQQGILLRLGRLVHEDLTDKVKVLNPGLHFKVPFVENVRIFDTRIQTMDIKSTRIVTKEKKDVMVDYYVKWQITDLAQYFRSTGGSEFKAETLLEQQLNTLLRAQFGKRTISEVVSGGRDDLTELLRKAAQKQAGGLGLIVVDVRIKGIELPANTSNAIYQRMRADMQKIANRHRADGQAAAEEIKAKADADVMVLLARTRSNAQKVRAIGQARAASIYAEAYNKNKDFFALFRSLLAYEGSFKSKKDILVLDQSSSFFNYFKEAIPKNDGVPAKK